MTAVRSRRLPLAGGGAPPASSERPLPVGAEKVAAVRAMFDAIAPRYDLVNRVMTFRLDVGWRRRAVDALGLGPGEVVLDLAAGTGDLCRDLSAVGLSPVGVDLSAGMLAHARTAAPLVQADATRLPVPDGRADGVVCGFALRNFADLGAFFDEAARVLRPGGRVSLLDVARPTSALLRLGHGLYFDKVVPRVGGFLSDPAGRESAPRAAYRYLPRSLAYLPPPPAMLERLRAAGFGAVERRLLSGGIAQLVTATRQER